MADWEEVKKGNYKDGHEKHDMIKYPEELFLPTKAVPLPLIPHIVRNQIGEIVDITHPKLFLGEKACIPVPMISIDLMQMMAHTITRLKELITLSARRLRSQNFLYQTSLHDKVGLGFGQRWQILVCSN